MVCAVVVMALALCPRVAFATGTVHYVGQAEGFIFAPHEDENVTDLFPLLKNVMPGDSLVQDIEVHNKDVHGTPVRIYLRALGADAESEEFLSQLMLTVDQVNGERHFEAAAHETAGLTDWVLLGTVPAEDNEELELTLTVPLSLDDSFQDAVGHLEWQFKVEEAAIDGGSGMSGGSGGTGGSDGSGARQQGGGGATDGGSSGDAAGGAVAQAGGTVGGATSRTSSPKTGDSSASGGLVLGAAVACVAGALVLRRRSA